MPTARHGGSLTCVCQPMRYVSKLFVGSCALMRCTTGSERKPKLGPRDHHRPRVASDVGNLSQNFGFIVESKLGWAKTVKSKSTIGRFTSPAGKQVRDPVAARVRERVAGHPEGLTEITVEDFAGVDRIDIGHRHLPSAVTRYHPRFPRRTRHRRVTGSVHTAAHS